MSGTPRALKTLLIGDDSKLLAELSCLFARRNRYVPVLDGPRMGRPDADIEAIRRNNAAARLGPDAIVLAGLDPRAATAFDMHFPPSKTFRVSSVSELSQTKLNSMSRSLPTFEWGRDRIGTGLLMALRQKRQIRLLDTSSPQDDVPSRTGELVVCEEGHELTQVIAANYAFAIDAGLILIPELPDEDADRILEKFYGAHEARQESTTEILDALRAELRERCGDLQTSKPTSITFVTNKVPWGFAYPEVPSTHLFAYPDLGISILNGILAEAPNAPGIRVAVLIDPAEVQASEMDTAIKVLKRRAVFISGMSGGGATVYRVSRMVEHFPYDLLLISTHCGDAPGWRWTYEFIDSEGRQRTLVTDIAIGVAGLPSEKDMLEVIQYTRFVSLDGVDWHDPKKEEKLYVGTAMQDWVHGTQGKELEPNRKETIPRVVGSAALKMADANYLVAHRSMADNGTPIVLNNACASWHELAKRFTFADARAYVGTLISVADVEAQEVISRLIDKHFGKPLAQALWQVQNEVYGGTVRRPYVLVGIGSQRFRTTAIEAPTYLIHQMRVARDHWRRQANALPADDEKKRKIEDTARFLEMEIEGIRNRWFTPRSK